jgi:hypothetical protein
MPSGCIFRLFFKKVAVKFGIPNKRDIFALIKRWFNEHCFVMIGSFIVNRSLSVAGEAKSRTIQMEYIRANFIENSLFTLKLMHMRTRNDDS